MLFKVKGAAFANHRHFLLVFLLFSVTACASVRVENGDGKTYRYFGYVEVQVPEKDARIEAYKIRSLGLAIEQGISLGWRDNEQVLVPLKQNVDDSAPAEATCSIVVIVRSDAEARHAREILSDLKGANICLTSFQ